MFLYGPALISVTRLHNHHWVLKQAPGDGADQVGRGIRLSHQAGRACLIGAGLKVTGLHLFNMLRAQPKQTQADIIRFVLVKVAWYHSFALPKHNSHAFYLQSHHEMMLLEHNSLPAWIAA